MTPERRIARCANAHRYKGNRPPICNGGQPCSACRSKWYRAEQVRKAKRDVRPVDGARTTGEE